MTVTFPLFSQFVLLLTIHAFIVFVSPYVVGYFPVLYNTNNQSQQFVRKYKTILYYWFRIRKKITHLDLFSFHCMDIKWFNQTTV